MATYAELYDLHSNSELRNKVTVALTIVAELIISGGDTSDPPFSQDAGAVAARQVFAATVLRDPGAYNKAVLRGLLAQSSDLTVSQILGATDTAIQNNVNALVDNFALNL